MSMSAGPFRRRSGLATLMVLTIVGLTAVLVTVVAAALAATAAGDIARRDRTAARLAAEAGIARQFARLKADPDDAGIKFTIKSADQSPQVEVSVTATKQGERFEITSIAKLAGRKTNYVLRCLASFESGRARVVQLP